MKSVSTFPTILALALCAACVTVDPKEEEKRAEEKAERVPVFATHTKQVFERNWTSRFASQAVLVADEVTIEGPSDLMQHVAVTQDLDVFAFASWTTKDGLRQETSVKPGVAEREVRAQLDGWTIVAIRKLHVLQRPGDAPVVVRAVGDAKLLPVDGGAEERGPLLVYRGEHTR